MVVGSINSSTGVGQLNALKLQSSRGSYGCTSQTNSSSRVIAVAKQYTTVEINTLLCRFQYANVQARYEKSTAVCYCCLD